MNNTGLLTGPFYHPSFSHNNDFWNTIGEKVKLSSSELSERRRTIEAVIKALLEIVCVYDKRFDFDAVLTGSVRQGVTIKDGSDFDYTLVFKNESNYFFGAYQPGLSVPDCYSQVILVGQGQRRKWQGQETRGQFLYQIRQSCVVMDNNGSYFLSSKLVLETFRNYLLEAKRNHPFLFSRVQEITSEGPAVHLRIQVNQLNQPVMYCDVDLTPALRCNWPFGEATLTCNWVNQAICQEIINNGILVVPKRHRQHPLGESLWYYSFVEAETTVMTQSDPGCRRLSLRILKACLGKSSSALMTSFNLKNIWLHECDEHANDWEWVDEMLGDRMSGLFERLWSYVSQGNCPHFFVPSVNLFEKMTQQDQQSVFNLLKSVRDQLCIYTENQVLSALLILLLCQ